MTTITIETPVVPESKEFKQTQMVIEEMAKNQSWIGTIAIQGPPQPMATEEIKQSALYAWIISYFVFIPIVLFAGTGPFFYDLSWMVLITTLVGIGMYFFFAPLLIKKKMKK